MSILLFLGINGLSNYLHISEITIRESLSINCLMIFLILAISIITFAIVMPIYLLTKKDSENNGDVNVTSK